MPIEIDLEKMYSRNLLPRKCEFILCITDDCVLVLILMVEVL